jgi:hypothetical protein
MSLENLLRTQQQGQQQMIDSVLNPRSRIAQSANNRKPGTSLLDGFYKNNPQLRSGEYDPTGSKAQGRRDFEIWQQDQLQRQLGYNQLSEARRAGEAVNGSQRPQSGLQAVVPQGNQPMQQPQQPAQPQQQPWQAQNPAWKGVPFALPEGGQMQQPQMAQSPSSRNTFDNGVRINPHSGMPYGYAPGDDVSGLSPAVQQAVSNSLQRMNQTTRDEVGRRNEQIGQANTQRQAQNQALLTPQMQYGVDPDTGGLVPKAMPVQGADARISPDMYNQATQRNAYGNYVMPTDEAWGLQEEFKRQNPGMFGVGQVPLGMAGSGVSAAGDLNKPTQVAQPQGMIPLIDASQYMAKDPYRTQQVNQQMEQPGGTGDMLRQLLGQALEQSTQDMMPPAVDMTEFIYGPPDSVFQQSMPTTPFDALMSKIGQNIGSVVSDLYGKAKKTFPGAFSMPGYDKNR